MKIIEFKLNDKLVFCEQFRDLTTAQYLEKQKEVIKFWQDKDAKIQFLMDKITMLEARTLDLYHQIAIDRGEEEPDNEEIETVNVSEIIEESEVNE